MDFVILFILPLIIGWLLDFFIGDPARLPHPIVLFGKMIARGEKRLNKGDNRITKGALMAIFLIALVFLSASVIIVLLYHLSVYVAMLFCCIAVFYCLAGTTLIGEVKQVFIAVDRSLEEGRTQLSRIVGRDTSSLNAQQIRTAALETLAENLSDGVIAPLFWYAVLGVPGMLAYKMINTLDSMIGYKSERYYRFGRWAARIDDVANYIPARLTAALMIVASGRFSLFAFVKQYARKHASPNSGYPESALAGILNCRFGGANVYFGTLVEKPYIGHNDKILTTKDMQLAVGINRKSELLMLILMLLYASGMAFIFIR